MSTDEARNRGPPYRTGPPQAPIPKERCARRWSLLGARRNRIRQVAVFDRTFKSHLVAVSRRTRRKMSIDVLPCERTAVVLVAASRQGNNAVKRVHRESRRWEAPCCQSSAVAPLCALAAELAPILTEAVAFWLVDRTATVRDRRQRTRCSSLQRKRPQGERIQLHRAKPDACSCHTSIGSDCYDPRHRARHTTSPTPRLCLRVGPPIPYRPQR